MKKLRVLLFLAVSIAYISCEDAYDIQQEGLEDEAVSILTVNDMDLYLNGIYANESIASEIAFTSIFTDETGVGHGNNGQGLDLYKLFLTNNDGYAQGIWLTHYSTINYVARLLRRAEAITPSAEDTGKYNNIIAEAKALRAFANLQLMSYFAEDMKDDSSLGIILLDRVPELNEELPRNTTGEIWAFVESDLNAAETGLTGGSAEQDYFYITKNAVNAIKARMYAYRGMYPQALAAANEVIDNNNVGLQLTPAGYLRTTTNVATINLTQFYNATTSNSDYRKMWSDAGRYEIIWGLTREFGGDAIASTWFTNSTTRGGGVFFDMGRNLFNLLWDQNGDGDIIDDSMTQVSQMDPADHDIRSRAFIDQTALVDDNYQTEPLYITKDILVIDKYPGSGATLRNNHKVFRLSEMYLIRAEAQVAAGDLPAAAATLQEIRNARTFELRNSAGTTVIQPALPAPLPDYAGNATAAWADILLERRKELCFEGHRYIDLRRLGALAGGQSIDRYTRDCTMNQVPVCGLDLTDHRYVLPIPIQEIIGNSAIQQNPGY